MKTTTIQKWGNSYAVRIPHASALKLHLKAGKQVHVILGAEGRELRIVPVSQKKFTFRELVSQITKDNAHGPVDWGASVGKEAW